MIALSSPPATASANSPRSATIVRIIRIFWAGSISLVVGGRPARSAKRRRMCAPNPLNVYAPTASATSGPSAEASRSRSSPAALFVNVNARTRPGSAPPRIMCTIREMITRVLPVPGPASTMSGPPEYVTAFRCALLSEASGS